MRVVLNRVYAYLMDGRDAEQREELEGQLYGSERPTSEMDILRALDEEAGEEAG